MCAVGEAHQTVCSISLGGLEAIARKGGTSVPNEDALFAADFGPIALHAVADGHRGHFASHEAIERVAELITEPSALAKALHSLDWLTSPTPEPDPEDTSATTLSLCVIDRANGKLEGWSAGDSAVFHLNLTKGVRRLDTPDTAYLSPRDETPPTNAAPHRFEATVRPGDVILSCSDGVFECHYGSPETSLTLADLESLFIRFSGDVDAYVEAISHDALMGVRGNPGGQDNIAIVASVV